MTTGDGLLALLELDEVPGLTDIVTCMLSEAVANDRRHDLSGHFRQSVYARLAGYENVIDQETLSWARLSARESRAALKACLKTEHGLINFR